MKMFTSTVDAEAFFVGDAGAIGAREDRLGRERILLRVQGINMRVNLKPELKSVLSSGKFRLVSLLHSNLSLRTFIDLSYDYKNGYT